MPRAHVYKILTGPNGDVITDASVLVTEHGTTTPVGVPMYAAASGSTTIPNPFNATTGQIEFFLDAPRRVSIVISREGVDSVAFNTVDVLVTSDPEPAPIETVRTYVNQGTAFTLVNNDVATVHDVTLNANATITFPALTSGKSFTLLLSQDATGGRTVTWPTSVRWPDGINPTITATPGRSDLFKFRAIGALWYGQVLGQNFP